MRVTIACSLVHDNGERCNNAVVRQAWVGKLGWMPVCEDHIEALLLPTKEVRNA